MASITILSGITAIICDCRAKIYKELDHGNSRIKCSFCGRTYALEINLKEL